MTAKLGLYNDRPVYSPNGVDWYMATSDRNLDYTEVDQIKIIWPEPPALQIGSIVEDVRQIDSLPLGSLLVHKGRKKLYCIGINGQVSDLSVMTLNHVGVSATIGCHVIFMGWEND